VKDEYDFTGAKRGRFFVKDALMVPRVHLETDVLSYLAACAEARGASLSELVNDLLRADIAVIKAAG
jgi:hypothetical protein